MNVDKMIKKVVKRALRRELVDSKDGQNSEVIMFDRLNLSFDANVKYEYIADGKVLLIHDVPLAGEMIQEYRVDGKIERHYKSAEDMKQMKVDFVPVIFNHLPNKGRLYQQDEATVKDLTQGWLSDGYFENGKKYANLYMLVDKLNSSRNGQRFLKRVEDNKSTDGSIGFGTLFDRTPGVFDGRHYDVKQTNHMLDHYALLLDAPGRAGFSEGYGVGADEIDTKKTEVDPVGKDDSTEILKDALSKADDAKKQLETQLSDQGTEMKKVQDERDALKKKNDGFQQEKDDALKAECDSLKEKLVKAKGDDMKDPVKLASFKTFLDAQDVDQLKYLADSIGDGKPVFQNGVQDNRRGASGSQDDGDKGLQKMLDDSAAVIKKKQEALFTRGV